MKKSIKLSAFVLSLSALILMSFSCVAYAEDYGDALLTSKSIYNGYEITAYDININVNKDNTLDVTEDITAYFHTAKHGIFRYIPYSYTMKQKDGKIKRLYQKVKNVKVNEEFDVHKENENCVIQIGDADTTIKGEKKYTISYTFVMGKDVNEGFDAFYYNIIGTGWDTTISDISFNIKMPDSSFDKSKLSLYTGKYGSTSTEGVTYKVNGNTISGKVKNGLLPHEALTATLFLDDGYFTFNYAKYYLTLASMIVIPIIALIAVIFLWSKFGRDKKVVDVVEFYPPENLNSAQVALWNKGSADDNDTIGLLIELANEGYIDIEEIEKKSVFSKYDCRIIRKKESYDGNDKFKRTFFYGLFKNGNESVLMSDLENSFYKTTNAVKTMLNDDILKVFNKKSLYVRFIGWSVSIISAVISIFICYSILGETEKIICCAAGVLISIASFILSFLIRQRTDEGHEIKQKINGFKIFLETAEKGKLETLVEENPKYFYDILPYAYVLGVSEKWVKKFEGLTIEKPSWYYSNEFSVMTMYYFMHRTMSDMARAMVSVPKNNGTTGGGFGIGSGGFSGGGFGGGGGGSW